MTRVTYLLSESFPYEKTICDDAGPGYARRHRWETAPLGAFRVVETDTSVVIDNRIVPEEFEVAEQAVRAFPRHPFFFKVIDPHWECIQQPYYRFLLRLARYPNVGFVGPYQQLNIINLLNEVAGRPAYLTIPFAYDSSREISTKWLTRRAAVAFTGSTHPTYYPERAAMLRLVTRRWWLWRRIRVLAHPGYPDVGQPLKHGLIHHAYFEFLAQFRFMYLEPSRDRLEFLKYSECAYAGCVPVGRAPATFSAALRELILPLESAHLRRDLRTLAATSPAACERTAGLYRERLKQARDPDMLNAALIAHYTEQTKRLGAL